MIEGFCTVDYTPARKKQQFRRLSLPFYFFLILSPTCKRKAVHQSGQRRGIFSSGKRHCASTV